MHRTWAVFIMVSLLGLAIEADAWDGQRKGFILGGGLGFGSTSFKQEVSYGGLSSTSDTESKAAFMTDFKIGYAWSNQWMVFYNSGTSWFTIENVNSDKVTISSDVSGIALSHYFKPAAPSWFLTGTLGFSAWDAPFEEDSEAQIGAGLLLGGGYEFARHWNLQADLQFSNPSDDEGGFEVTTTATTFRLTVNVLGY